MNNLKEYFLIAESHPIAKMGYSTLIDLHFRGSQIKFVDKVEDFKYYLENHGNLYSFAICDLDLNDGCLIDHVDFLQGVINKFPTMPILIITAIGNLRYVNQLYDIGVRGVITNISEETEIIHAISEVMRGVIYENKMVRKYRAINASKSLPPIHKDNPFLMLSNRELSVLKMLVGGVRLKSIAEQLNVRQSTIATYKHRMLEKLNIENIITLYNKAKEYKII